jgi:hypothetical protein
VSGKEDEMKACFELTFGEISERGLWDEFCALKGINPWCMNEGLASKNELVTLTREEADEIGLNWRTDES